MVVAFLAGLVLVALETLTEVELASQASFDDQPQCPVDRGLADVLAPLVEEIREIVYREVAITLEERHGDRLALMRERQVPIVQVFTEEVDQQQSTAEGRLGGDDRNGARCGGRQGRSVVGLWTGIDNHYPRRGVLEVLCSAYYQG